MAVGVDTAKALVPDLASVTRTAGKGAEANVAAGEAVMFVLLAEVVELSLEISKDSQHSDG